VEHLFGLAGQTTLARRFQALRFWKNADNLLGFAELLEVDKPIACGKECVIATDADVRTGLKPGAALTHDNASGSHKLATKALHTEPLRITVTTIP
jgi:hypothetical protein